jgi:hypothetical protein
MDETTHVTKLYTTHLPAKLSTNLMALYFAQKNWCKIRAGSFWYFNIKQVQKRQAHYL